jgi:hypothetical protein
MLVEGKREEGPLHERMPEAISQAIALCELARSVLFLHVNKTLA